MANFQFCTLVHHEMVITGITNCDSMSRRGHGHITHMTSLHLTK